VSERRSNRAARAVFVASAVVSLALCALPDSMGDILNYRLWARTLARDGLTEAYWPSHPLVVSAERLDAPIDYPPVFPYLMLVAGRLAESLSLSDRTLDSLVRVPLALAHLAIGLVLFRDTRRLASERAPTLVAALYLFNPGIVFDTVYWGQADALTALFVVAALTALAVSRPEWAWASFALAVLTKPLAYPFGPLLLVVTVKRFGWRRALRCGAVFLACAFLVLVPFLWIGRLGPLLRSLFVQLDAMPYASVNAHNSWWLVQRGTPWLDTREIAFGAVSYGVIGLALLAVFVTATLVRLARSDSDRGIRLAFASTAFGFFMLATHMHENHAFVVLPLLLLVGWDEPRVRRFYVLVSALFLANMALHDPYLTHVFRAWTPGPRLLLPQEPDLDPRFYDYFLANGYGYVVEQIRGETSALGLGLTALNAQLAVLTFAWWLWSFYRGSSFDEALARPEPAMRWRWVLPAAVAFVVVTSLPFAARAMRENRAPLAAVGGR
jgi:hypothetical protein